MDAATRELTRNSLLATRKPAQREGLPHPASFFADHLLARLAAKSLGEIFRILHGAVHTISSRRVGVCLGQQPHAFRGLVLAPDLRKAEEKAPKKAATAGEEGSTVPEKKPKAKKKKK